MYSAVILITCLMNIILISVVTENQRIGQRVKASFILTGIIIILASFFEWGALMLNGTSYVMLHAIVKGCDYIFTPLMGWSLIMQMDEEKKIRRVILLLVILNFILVVCSLFTGWIFYLDAENYYYHGPLYPAYSVTYVLIYLCCLYSFIRYCRHYKRRNLFTLTLSFLMIILGIIVQEGLSSDYRVFYLASSIGIVFLYIHYVEFYQQRNDEYQSMQEKLLRTDTLTQMQNRYAYHELISRYEKGVPDTIAVFSIDITLLKPVNDRYGHEAGDELIVAAAEIIMKELSSYGSCFRIGGDEYVCIVNMKEKEAFRAKCRLLELADAWKGSFQQKLYLAIGYVRAEDYKDRTLEELIVLSDQMMYKEKKTFYALHPEYRR